MELGELLGAVDPKRKERPLIDQFGNECWWTDLLIVIDPRFAKGDPRHQVAAGVNRHRSDTGTICGSGKWDPGKAELQIDGRFYARFRTRRGREPHCMLCENGDMIAKGDRFRDSVYRPE